MPRNGKETVFYYALSVRKNNANLTWLVNREHLTLLRREEG